MKKKMVAMLLGLALAASTLGGCGEATVSEDTTEVVEEVETEEAEDTEETEEVTEEAEDEEEVEAEVEETEEVAEKEVSDESEATEEAETEIEAEVEETTETEVVYTYSEVTATMYAKQSVNVRDLPSTSGNRVGGLSTNQEVSVTGQCNETGWYRISYNGTDAYVSNNYLVSEKVATQTTSTSTTATQTETQQSTQTTSTTSTATQVSTQSSSSSLEDIYNSLPLVFSTVSEGSDLYMKFANAGYGKKVSLWCNSDGTCVVYQWDGVTQGYTGYGATDSTTTTTTTTTTPTFTQVTGYSTECVGYINDLRDSVGVGSLTWSDSLAEVALARAKELADAGALDGHAGLSKYGSYGENTCEAYDSASEVYNCWVGSSGHYNNMVNSSYTYVAVAYATGANGHTYWVTIFQS